MITDFDVVLACQEAERRLSSWHGATLANKHGAGQLLINFAENRKLGSPEDCEKAMIRAFARGYIEVKTNLRWATLTEKGRKLAKEERA